MKTTLLMAKVPSAHDQTAEVRRRKTAEVRRRLLQTGMREAGIPIDPADGIIRSPDGKPRLSGYPDFHFSLSHSGDYIACIFSGDEIGLDLQEHRQPVGISGSCLRIARRFFTAQEYAALQALQAQQTPESGSGGNSSLQKDPVTRLFYHLWTIKEAYLKYIGCGLRGNMAGFYPLPLPDPQFPVQGFRGKIEVSEDKACNTDHVLFHPAAYALLPAPKGYSMAVCAKKLPAGICIRSV